MIPRPLENIVLEGDSRFPPVCPPGILARRAGRNILVRACTLHTAAIEAHRGCQAAFEPDRQHERRCGIEPLHDEVIILASNRHDLIDPAILRPGRIDRKIKVERPDYDAAREIFAIYLTGELPIDREELARAGDQEAARQGLIEAAMAEMFGRGEGSRFLEVALRSGRQEVLYWGDLASGALIASIVQRAKEVAIKRAIAAADPETGLRGEDLSVAARILSVAECYDSAISARPHRGALPPEEALQMIRGGAGTLFDPEVAQLFTVEAPPH